MKSRNSSLYTAFAVVFGLVLFTVGSVEASFTVQVDHDSDLEMHEQITSSLYNQVIKEKSKKSKFEIGTEIRMEIESAMEQNDYTLLSDSAKEKISQVEFDKKVKHYYGHVFTTQKIEAMKASKTSHSSGPELMQEDIEEIKEEKNMNEGGEDAVKEEVETVDIKKELEKSDGSKKDIVKSVVRVVDQERLQTAILKIDTALELITDLYLIDILEMVREVILEVLEG